jgi:hypothetical protein
VIVNPNVPEDGPMRPRNAVGKKRMVYLHHELCRRKHNKALTLIYFILYIPALHKLLLWLQIKEYGRGRTCSIN